MSRWLPCLLLFGVVGLASCSPSPHQERLAELEAEVAKLKAEVSELQADREALQARHEQAIGDRSPEERPGTGAERPPHHVAQRDDSSAHGRHDGRHDHHDRVEGGHDRSAHAAHPEDRHAEGAHDHEHAQTAVRPTGTVIGVMEQIEDSGDRHVKIQVLAPGEEKAREYFVYNQPDVLAAVRTGKVGDTVEVGWVQTNHGPAIETFKVLE